MKTSRLSLAAIAALGITVSATANDLIPITLPDDKWKMVGVPGGFSSTSSGATSFTADETKSETVNDNQYTDFAAAGLSMISFMVVDGVTNEPSTASLSIDVQGQTNDDTFATFGMYVTHHSSATPNIHIKYQADFEGDTFQMTIDGLSYSGVFSSANTQSNPLVLTAITSSTASQELDIIDIFDADISDNPGNENGTSNIVTNYASTDKDAMGGTDDLRIYNYNAGSQKWETYYYHGTNGASATNNFSTLTPGKSYWVRFDNNAGSDQPGLILGSGGITSSTHSTMVSDGNISNGWNMLSFDDYEIRGGGTGLVLTAATPAATYTFDIKDEHAINSLTVTVRDTDESGGVNYIDVIESINSAVAAAKQDGTLPQDFNIVALPSAAAKIVILSDKAFRIGNQNNVVFGDVTTLTGADPIHTVNAESTTGLWTQAAVTALDDGANANAASDPHPDEVMSVYGENFVIVRPNFSVADGTAESGPLGVVTGVVALPDANGAATTATFGASAVLTAGAITTANANIKNVTLDIDTGGEIAANDDSFILASTAANGTFYLKDQVFTRVYDVNATAANGRTGDPVITNPAITLSTDSTTGNVNGVVADIVTDGANIEAVAISGGATATGQIAVVSTTAAERYFDIKDTIDSGKDIFTLSTSTDDKAKGAIKEVWSGSGIAQAPITKTTYTLVAKGTIAGGQTLTIGFADNGLYASVVSTAAIAAANGTTTTAVASAVADAINTKAVSSDMDVFASASGSTVTVTGYNLILSGGAATGSSGTANGIFCGNGNDDFIGDNAHNDIFECAANDSSVSWGGKVDYTSADAIIDDLKYDAVYAPDYSTDKNSPIYSLAAAGKEVKKILSPVEHISSGAISWSYLDLTKSSDTFNISDRYTLFRTDKEKGYWVYVGDRTNPLSFSVNPDVTATTMIHHFDKTDFTVDNIIYNASVSASVSGIVGSSDLENVIAEVGGNKIFLTKSGTQFTGSFSTHELSTALSDSDYNLTISVLDEYGNYLTDGVEFNLTKPTISSVTVSGSNVEVNTTAASKLRVYSDSIVESNLATNFEDNVSIAGGTSSFNYCKYASDFDSSIQNMQVVAVGAAIDNESTSVDGDPDKAMVSNISLINSGNSEWYALYKDASVITAAPNSTGSLPTTFDTNCSSQGVATSNNGLYVQNLTADKNVTVAYKTQDSYTLSTMLGIDLIKEGYVSISGTKVAKITYHNGLDTSADTVLIGYNGGIYKTTFAGIDGGTEASPVNLTTNVAVSGQTLSTSGN